MGSRRIRAVVAGASVLSLALALVALPARAATGGTPPANEAERVAGSTRFATSVAISKKLPVGQNFVILALGTNFPDALAASPAAYDTGAGSFAPILLTQGTSLDSGVKDEIDRRLNPGDTVLLMGGSAALSPSIDAALSTAGYTPRRLTSYSTGSGQPLNRFDTAAALAETLTASPTTKLSEIIVTSGLNFPDALAASPYAALHRVPILLVTPTGIPAETQKFLDNHANTSTIVHVIGGTAAAAAPSGVIVNRVAGVNRFATAVAVGKNLFDLTVSTSDRDDKLMLARGDNAGGGADALGGGPLAGSLGAPLLLTDPGSLPTDTAVYLSSLGYDRPLRPARSYILGGTVAITAAAATSWSNQLLNLAVAGGKSTTYRDLVNGSASATPGSVTGCQAPTSTQTFTWTVTGDLPGKLVVDATFCQVGDGVQAEAATVLPGSAAKFTPTGGAEQVGTVTGGSEGVQSNPPSGSRQASIDFVIDSANLVGHVVFGNPGSRSGNTDTDGWLALVGGAARQGFDGNFTTPFPTTPLTCGSVNYDGAIGPVAVTITGMTACRTAGTIWRISGGTVSGGYTGNVLSGVRQGNNLGLALRTSAGLVDVFAVVDGSLHSAGSSSPAMVQSLPENDAAATFTVGAGTPGTAPGCSGYATGATFSAVVHPPMTFSGSSLNLQKNVIECQTDVSVGIVEPTIVGATGTEGLANRSVLYTLTGGERFRGRIATSMFVGSGSSKTYYLTLIIEENNTHMTPGPLPPAALVDDPGNSFTVVRLVASSSGGPGPVTFAR